jgi:gas vesicle protein
MSSGKVLLGILAGAAAGAMLGILFAPEKGATTRKKILSKGEDYADELKEKFGEFVDTVSDKYESVVHKAKKEAETEAAE